VSGTPGVGQGVRGAALPPGEGGPRVDLTDPGVFGAGVPHEEFARLRREDPVSWTPEPHGRGFWSVTRYSDVVTVHREVGTYSSQVGATALEDLEPDALAARASMLDLDPPEHTRLRRTVAPEFTRRSVGGYRTRVQDVVRQVLAEVLPSGGETVEFEAVSRVATTIPIRVLCQVLGVPEKDEPLLIELGDRMIGNTDPDLAQVLLDSQESDAYRLLPFRSPAALQMHAYGRELAVRKQRDPGSDLVTALVQGRAPGTPRLAGAEFDAMFLLLVVAGNETTRSALALGLQAFAEYPDQWDLLAARVEAGDPEAIAAAAEEVLRWTTPLHHFRRTATRDTELAGQVIAAEDKVVVWYPSANRDGTVFTDPDRFDVTRTPNQHVSFGRGGPHRCLGEHLARLEIQVVLEELLPRVVRFEVAGPVRRVRSNFVHGLKSLPLRAVPRRPTDPLTSHLGSRP